jgi:UDP-N-acetylmuramoyl-tripeptide--D-alanyl-D-alanine ligase
LSAARQRNFGKRIAVTGSVGKTSTKEMLRAAFAAAGRVHASDKSFNNHWGVPLTLARMPMSADYSVFEIGMNHAGEITPLTRLVAPHVAVVTTIGEAHIENLGSRENIARAKAEIFLGVEKGGTAVLPMDNDFFGLLRDLAQTAGVTRIVTFGESREADIRLNGYAMREDGGEVSAAVFGEPFDFSLSAPGKHQAMNALAVLGAARAIGVSAAKAASGLKGLGAAAGRGAQSRVKLKSGGEIVILDESYNANPTSMAAAISLLGQLKPRGVGRRIAVLGEMLELGPDAPALHAGLSEALVAARVDRLYVAGALMRNLWDKTPAPMRGAASADAKSLAPEVLASIKDGDIVMVKGSNASKVSEIVAALKAAGL